MRKCTFGPLEGLGPATLGLVAVGEEKIFLCTRIINSLVRVLQIRLTKNRLRREKTNKFINVCTIHIHITHNTQ